MKVTAKEIAQQLGLSQAAVSLALRGRPGVSEATRRQVLAKAQELGFAPPEHAQEDPSNMISLSYSSGTARSWQTLRFFSS